MVDVDGRGAVARVAVLGTGIMGSAMARNLAAAGLHVTVWDRSPSVTAPLSAVGALTRCSPRLAERRFGWVRSARAAG